MKMEHFELLMSFIFVLIDYLLGKEKGINYQMYLVLLSLIITLTVQSKYVQVN